MGLKVITDKDLIVYLAAKGMEIKDVKKDEDHNRSLIYFDDNEDLRRAVIDYVNKTDKINIADFIAAERRIKTLLCMQKS